MPGLVTEAARLQQELSEATKESESRGPKLTSLKEVTDEFPTIRNDVVKLLSFVAKVREYRLVKNALTHQLEVEMKLLEEREKTLDRN